MAFNMRALIQRVTKASVDIDGDSFNSINQGLVVFLGIGKNDSVLDVEYLINKILKLRIFEDDKNKMNFSIQDFNLDILMISQFTLYANCSKGNRPSFQDSAKPKLAEKLYDTFVNNLKKRKINVKTGKFGANMNIQLINQGPITIMLDSKL